MSEVCFIVTPSGLVPADDDAKDTHRKWKLGAIVHSDFKQMRNGAFFRKWWSLVTVGYDYWEDTFDENATFIPKLSWPKYSKEAGWAVDPIPLKPNFERFRKDITILAGFYTATYNVNGEVRLEAESLQWSKMSEERFTKLYDATIQVLLTKVFNGQRVRNWTEAELRAVVEDITEFAA